MALTLDDHPTLAVETAASPRWQRFAGGRRLAHVGYRRRLLRIALGTAGAALVGGTIALGDGRTAAETWSSAVVLAHEVSRDVTASTEASSRSVTSSWDALAAWARIDTPPRRTPPETHASGFVTAASPTAIAQFTATREPSPTAAASPIATVIPATAKPNGAVVDGLASPSPTVTSRPATNPVATTVPNASGAGSAPAQPSPTTSARQPAGTPIAVVTSTPAAVIPTATVPRPTQIPATATAPRPAPTAAKPATPISHQVVAGDTLWGIATRYGTSVEAIMRANRLPDADSIIPGARLVIPR